MDDRRNLAVGIIDYGAGNLFNLQRAFNHLRIQCTIEAEPLNLGKYSHLVLPGVGAFGPAMEKLSALGFVSPIRESAASGTPLLGVCLGFQLLFAGSEEGGGFNGLEILKGQVRSLKGLVTAPDVRIPHVGWSQVNARAETPLLHTLNGRYFYFVHSFYAAPDDDAINVGTALIDARPFCAAVESENVAGTQFHPEMSGKDGLTMLSNFMGF